MRKMLKIMLCWTIFFLTSKTSFAGYTLQIKALPMEAQQAGLKLYNNLKNKQYLVYYYTTEVKDKPCLRIMLGYFADKA
jgi:septal ring-binding cell division protein DamX